MLFRSGSRAEERTEAARPASRVESLTGREIELLRLLHAGLSNQKLADALLLSVPTIKWHLHNVYEKLGVHDRPSAQLAIRRLQLADGGGPGQC